MSTSLPGPVVVSEETVEPAPVQALAALFDDGLPVPRSGDPLPPLWHWVALASWPGAGGTGPDGHPATGGFLPDVGKPRRMFAGGTVRVGADLRLGDVVRREAWIAGVTEKSGRQGDLVVVRVASRLVRADGEVAVSETQDLLYRDASSPAATTSPVPAPLPVVPTLLDRLAPGHWRFRTDPTKLMRFSSATGNGHRIHYDWPYATGVEGYPGLVVHGPLMTLAVAEVARLEGLRVQEITHRNRRPLFCGRAAGIRLLPGTGPRRELVLAREDEPALPYTTLAVSVAGGRPLTPSAAPGE